MIELCSVYAMEDVGQAIFELYQHLAERTPEQSISHKAMPTFLQHREFVDRHPYAAWYMILNGKSNAEIIGNIYLTKHREVGIHITRPARGQGYGRAALEQMRALHPGRILANINPKNEPSIAFFKQHGARLLQLTFEL